MSKHLTYDDRLEIERYLKLDYSLSAISKDLHRHKSTISREILLDLLLLIMDAMAVVTMHVFIGTIVI